MRKMLVLIVALPAVPVVKKRSARLLSWLWWPQ